MRARTAEVLLLSAIHAAFKIVNKAHASKAAAGFVHQSVQHSMVSSEIMKHRRHCRSSSSSVGARGYTPLSTMRRSSGAVGKRFDGGTAEASCSPGGPGAVDSCTNRRSGPASVYKTGLSLAIEGVSASTPAPRSAMTVEAYFTGGSDNPRPPSTDKSLAIAAEGAMTVRGGGGDGKNKSNRLLLDQVEDVFGLVRRAASLFLVPLFHAVRFNFGLALLFYGMSFRTVAFHVIVFRLAGLSQVKKAFGQMCSKYREARQAIREAAAAAGSVRGRVTRGDTLEEARKKMIAEKKELLADGYLSAEETTLFMERHNENLMKIMAEQERFKSARSSMFSVRSSVDPQEARASIGGLYNALVTSFTASTIQAAGQITLGLHVGSLIKTHILDMFGWILDPVGYRLDLNTYYDKEDIPYMGKANAMDGPSNMILNLICYSAVFAIFRVHPSIALKTSMIYYGGRVVTDYIVHAIEPILTKLKLMPIDHTPWSAMIHAALTFLGFYFHRNTLFTVGKPSLHPLAVGPGLIGLMEPFVRLTAEASEILHHIDFFTVQFVQDPVELVRNMAEQL